MAGQLDPLVQFWNSISGTIQAKLLTVNAQGAALDLSPVLLQQYLLSQVSGTGSNQLTVYHLLVTWSTTAVTGNMTHDVSISAAKALLAYISSNITVPGSDVETAASLAGWCSALNNQETATAGTTGFTQAVYIGAINLIFGDPASLLVLPKWYATLGFGAGGMTIADVARLGLGGNLLAYGQSNAIASSGIGYVESPASKSFGRGGSTSAVTVFWTAQSDAVSSSQGNPACTMPGSGMSNATGHQ